MWFAKKYKKCHLLREQQDPLKDWEINKSFQNIHSRRKCSASSTFQGECKGNIIRAHTVPKSNSLKAIAENGHVLGLNFSYEKIKKNRGKATFEKIGINRASTFNGFCKYHDDMIFAPLEKYAFQASKEQCFLLSYRAFAREYYAKEGAEELTAIRSQLDKGKSIDTQMNIYMKNFLYELGTQAALADLKHQMNFFDLALGESDFSSVRALIFSLDEPPPIMVCGCINPDFNFDGQLIQDLMDFTTRAKSLSLTSFYDGYKGYIVFSWLENSDEICRDFIMSLLRKNKEDYMPLIIQYIFKNFENVFVSPSWWGNTSRITQNILMELFSENISHDTEVTARGITKPLAQYNFPKITEIIKVGY